MSELNNKLSRALLEQDMPIDLKRLGEMARGVEALDLLNALLDTDPKAKKKLPDIFGKS